MRFLLCALIGLCSCAHLITQKDGSYRHHPIVEEVVEAGACTALAFGYSATMKSANKDMAPVMFLFSTTCFMALTVDLAIDVMNR